MGDISNMNDLERFMRSPEGQEYLEAIRKTLTSRRIVKVDFVNEVHYVAMTLHLDDGTAFTVSNSSLQVETLRMKFEEVIEREYYLDFPQRNP